MDRKLSCALFDLDNTLTDRSASIIRFAQRFFEDFHHILREGVTFGDVLKVIQIGDGGGYRPKEMMFQEIQTHMRWIVSPSIETISEYWYRVSPQSMQLRLGVQQVLEKLHHKGFHLGIVTNGKTDVQNATIDAIHIRKYFTTVVISEECGFRKPEPQIFYLALSTLNVAPENAVYIGDYPQADIEGARNAGLQAVWFAGVHPWPEDLTPPQYQLTEMTQLLDIIG